MSVKTALRPLVAALFLIVLPVSAKAGPALVVEAKSGLVLYAEDADRIWHPASLTKLMTAYLTFQALRDGKLSMADKVKCSQNARLQPPSKLGLPLGAEISVELALKSLIVKSANDVAVMVAERVAGTEEAFVQRMNETAERLGMKNTKFFNPHGLPDKRQVTTARDMAILARTITKEFPEHADLFALQSFEIGGRRLRSHNRILRTFEGADGMKTGFICASGFNVVASATRGDLSIMAVVLGEKSSRERRKRAERLIQYGFDFHGWKTMFSATLDQMAVNPEAENTPANLRPVVCAPRRAEFSFPDAKDTG